MAKRKHPMILAKRRLKELLTENGNPETIKDCERLTAQIVNELPQCHKSESLIFEICQRYLPDAEKLMVDVISSFKSDAS